MTTPSDRPARDEFRILHMQERGGSVESKKALDEIDRLRKELKAYKKIAGLAVLDRCRPVLEALEHYDKTGEMP